ncbi:glycosyltransferase family 2 protein [Flavobacterium sandaracinum]|uniref:Glycosyltransferase family 2 protein n=1 Tax=Flavobacterium sandaracinum TaxID=2541733 RepID=A0A4R5D523_9FLAO|nr:glycosyltransferase family 2 protein [Flavobacterium sandaracinum]TDE07607.1 glycosyltransferase family 2 protein [Flavobacterium sandaracinum]
MDISIIIVNYKGWKALDECLESIDSISSKTFSFEVIIVDNFSNDGQFPVFKHKYSKFTFIENTGNNGFSNGCNFGASIATGNHFLFLNPDTKLTLEALETLLQTAISHPEIGIVSCLQINENNVFYKQTNLFPALGRFFGISRALFRKLNKPKLEKRFNTTTDLFYPDWVTGAVIFISRNWFDKIKGWNEDYWLYFEDVDLCKKVADLGGKIAVTRKATIFHQHGGASRINVKTKALTKTEVIISKHVYISNQFSTGIQIYLQSLLILGVLLEKILLSIISLFLFFIPKLKVNRLMLKNLTVYYFNALQKQTWISPRAMNYLKTNA